MIAAGNKTCLFDIYYLFGNKLDYLVEENPRHLLEDICEYRGDIFLCTESDYLINNMANKMGYCHGVDYYLVADIANIIDKVYPIKNGLKPSQLFLEVYFSPHGKYKPCERALYSAEVDKNGDVYACCSAWQKFAMGNIIKDGLYKSWNSFFAKILRLSTLNGTFCFCRTNRCANAIETVEPIAYQYKVASSWPYELNIAIDDVCNLQCRFCREHLVKLKKEEKEKRIAIAQILKRDIENITDLYVAGNGEVFASEVYEELLVHMPKGKKITLVTNGLLYNTEKVIALSKKTDYLSVYVSIDAARGDTYEYLRKNGSFKELKERLAVIKQQRAAGIIKRLVFRFVVQKRNYREMVEFITFGREYLADYIDFTRIVDNETEYTKVFSESSLLDEHGKLYPQYKEWFKQPIFRDSYIHIDHAFIEKE